MHSIEKFPYLSVEFQPLLIEKIIEGLNKRDVILGSYIHFPSGFSKEDISQILYFLVSEHTAFADKSIL